MLALKNHNLLGLADRNRNTIAYFNQVPFLYTCASLQVPLETVCDNDFKLPNMMKKLEDGSRGRNKQTCIYQQSPRLSKKQFLILCIRFIQHQLYSLSFLSTLSLTEKYQNHNKILRTNSIQTSTRVRHQSPDAPIFRLLFYKNYLLYCHETAVCFSKYLSFVCVEVF